MLKVNEILETTFDCFLLESQWTSEVYDVCALALLHDIVEDTPLTSEEVIELIWPTKSEIMKEYLVHSLNDLTTTTKERNNKAMIQLGKAYQMDTTAALVKMVDRYHNLSDLSGWDISKQLRYFDESEDLMRALHKNINEYVDDTFESIFAAAASIVMLWYTELRNKFYKDCTCTFGIQNIN